ncbi:MAG: nuclear transport factor 2 family protein [Burkholderiales bacterium]
MPQAMQLVLSVLLCVPLAGHAGPLDERAAEAHLKAVAAGNVDTLMSAYGDEPYLDWIGGPLDGRYRGSEAIRDLWKKFAAANDNQPRTMQRTVITQSGNPKGVTLTANAEYVGKTTVRVHHVLVYRDTRLVSEIWQIDPAAALTPAAP